MDTHTLQQFSQYCNSLLAPSRLNTLEVAVGDVKMGGNNPIVLQSMTTADTMDTLKTVEESIRMIETGCQVVRITAPSKSEAENLANIKAELRRRGYNTPLVADIHFTPNAAEIAARIVEKVRVNPGNYADKKKFEQIDYTDAAYQAELDRIAVRFTPLVKICKEYGTAMRIGVNHGSLSDRILSRYGDTPEGMVMSALEFIDICELHGYRNLVVSMKASNPTVMVHAYRMLAQQMLKRGTCYPLHLGVTEAGEGEDGRIKSALGIGALLADGLGDTIRVSLTEPPEFETPVAAYIVRHYQQQQAAPAPALPDAGVPIDPCHFVRRDTRTVRNLGGAEVPRVVADLSHLLVQETALQQIGHSYNPALDKWNMTDQGADYLYAGSREVPFMLPNGLRVLYDYALWQAMPDRQNSYPVFPSLDSWLKTATRSAELNLVVIQPDEWPLLGAGTFGPADPVALVLNAPAHYAVQVWRNWVFRLHQLGIHQPVILRATLHPDEADPSQSAEARLQLTAACTMSQPLTDGLADGIWLHTASPATYSPALLNRTAFGMLQAARQRMTKTEYISCPSCGRTLFDLQETTAKIRARTEHLKGVKIGIMGCIVNGPGEMADADYGYVGSGAGIITLYRGKEVVERAIATEHAVDKLIDLIREDGKWVEVG